MPRPGRGGPALAAEPAGARTPAARTDAAIVAAGLETLLVGGSDGKAAQDSVFATVIRTDGNIDGWTAGRRPARAAGRRGRRLLRRRRAFIIGGARCSRSADRHCLQGHAGRGHRKITSWAVFDDLKLPAPRADATAVVTGDGILLVGGRDADGPVASVWQAPLKSATGALQPWRELAAMPNVRAGATAVVLGSNLFVYGGVDAAGPTPEVLRGEIGLVEGDPIQTLTGWFAPTEASAGEVNLPVARLGAMGFVSNGILYYVGGEGGAGELYWSIPDADGNLTGWKTLAQSALPADLQLADAAPVVSGSHAFLVGGTAAGVPTQGVARASLAPPQPFFQLGLFYVVLPALGIGGEVGQQLSYLVAAGVGTANFVLLILIGYLYNHPAKAAALRDRFRNRRRHAA